MSLEKYIKNLEIKFKQDPFNLNRQQKKSLMFKNISFLHDYHINHCKNYKTLNSHLSKKKIKSLEDFPFIHVNLFKEIEMISIEKIRASNVITSSGTSSENVSKIFLDRTTSKLQIKVLQCLFSDITKKKIPMLVVDSKEILNTRKNYNARLAAFLGFQKFSSSHTFLLNENYEIDFENLNNFLIKNDNQEEILIFGFTSVVFEYLYKKIHKFKFLNDKKILLIHGGGWKKLSNLKISNNTFKSKFKKNFKSIEVINYYGMAEQTGTIYFECEEGYFHTNNFSDILIRDQNLDSVDHNQEGLIQLFSTLPISYPGFNILTEDLGTIYGEDDCKCGRLGKYFKVHGRIQKAQIRGCSDVY